MKPADFVLFLCALMPTIANGENLLVDGGFELPVIEGRVPAANGGNPALPAESGWERLADKKDDDGGKLIAGLTNEVAHSGKQAFFLNFERLTARSQIASLTTKPIAIKPSTDYRVAIWGRIDRDRPIALDERRPYIVITVDFLQADEKTSAGDSQHAPAAIPGEVVPGGSHELLFVSRRWTEMRSIVRTPDAAAFLRVTWTWTSTGDEGETDGVVYWDDASVEVSSEPPADAEKNDKPSSTTAPSGAAKPRKPNDPLDEP
jgi:hypothetical protein